MGPLGWQETIFIFVLALLVFGPKKLPELGKTIGKAMTEFRRATSDLKGTWDREMAAMERETGVGEATRKIDNEIAAASVDQTYHGAASSYDSGYDYGYGVDNSHANELAAAITPGLETTPSTDGATATQGAGTTVAELEEPPALAESGDIPQVADTIAREKPGSPTADGKSDS